MQEVVTLEDLVDVARLRPKELAYALEAVAAQRRHVFGQFAQFEGCATGQVERVDEDADGQLQPPHEVQEDLLIELSLQFGGRLPNDHHITVHHDDVDDEGEGLREVDQVRDGVVRDRNALLVERVVVLNFGADRVHAGQHLDELLALRVARHIEHDLVTSLVRQEVEHRMAGEEHHLGVAFVEDLDLAQVGLTERKDFIDAWIGTHFLHEVPHPPTIGAVDLQLLLDDGHIEDRLQLLREGLPTHLQQALYVRG